VVLALPTHSVVFHKTFSEGPLAQSTGHMTLSGNNNIINKTTQTHN